MKENTGDMDIYSSPGMPPIIADLEKSLSRLILNH
jgi:hypothetical protein